MSEIKSLSVDNGDMFYINHNTDNFSMIDCNITDERKSEILDEVKNLAGKKGVVRFISTHPDQDHIQGIEYLDELGLIKNFYYVDNNVSKSTETESFKKYKDLKESSCAYKIYKGCKRKWMNVSDGERGSAGISVLWPDVNNETFRDALRDAESSDKPNNISPAIVYSLDEGVRALGLVTWRMTTWRRSKMTLRFRLWTFFLRRIMDGSPVAFLRHGWISWTLG